MMNPCHSWKSAWDSAFIMLKRSRFHDIAKLCLHNQKSIVFSFHHGSWPMGTYKYSDLFRPNFSILIFNPMIQFISIIFHWIKSQNWFYLLLPLLLPSFFRFHVRVHNHFGFISVIYGGLMLVPNSNMKELRFRNFVRKLH